MPGFGGLARGNVGSFVIRGVVVFAILAALVFIRTPESGYSAAAPGGPYTGVWTWGPGTAEGQALDDLGAGWARATVSWDAVEPTNGTFVWTGLDQQMSSASGGGKRTVLALVRENPAWAAASRCTLTTDAERQQLAAFVGALAGRYQGVVWQLYNEEDNTSVAYDTLTDVGGCFGTASGGVATTTGRVQYARAIEAVATAVHNADPTAQIAAGGVASANYLGPTFNGAFDQDFIPGVVAQLKQDNSLSTLNYVTVHFYSSQAWIYSAMGPDLVGRVNKFRQDMLGAGLSSGELPAIMADELSYTDGPSTSTSDPTNAYNQLQAAYVPKLLARAANAGVRAVFWFMMQDAVSGLGADYAYGLKDLHGGPKPSYAAMRYFNTVVKGANQFVRAVALSGVSPKLEGYQFTTLDGHALQIVWNQTDTSQLTYVVAGTIVSVNDPEGNAVAWTGNTVAIGAEPRFITYTPAPTATPSPTLTQTPIPTNTPLPSATPQPSPTGGPWPGSKLVLTQPQRVVDTRTGSGYLGAGQPLLGYDSANCFQIGGTAGIPGWARGVVLNVTTTQHPGEGYVALWPSGQPIPGTSTVNFNTVETAIANSTTVRLGADGQVCARGLAGTHLILDVTGYLVDSPNGATTLLATPARLVDTRAGSGYLGAGQPLPGYSTPVCYPVAGVAGIPLTATGVVVNLTTTGHTAEGYVSVFPRGGALPPTSNVNFSPVEFAIANGATIRLGDGGQICARGLAGTQLIIDVIGYLSDASPSAQVQLLPQPVRAVDTRSGSGYQGAGQPMAGYGTPACYLLTWQTGVPSNAVGVILNVTATGYPSEGYISLFPKGGALPPTSTLNFVPAEYAIANGASMSLGDGGQICARGLQGTQLIFDVVGYLLN